MKMVLDLGGGDIIILWIYLTSLNYIFKMVIMLIFIDIARIFFKLRDIPHNEIIKQKENRGTQGFLDILKFPHN